MNQTIYDLILIGIAAITTFLLRALPFLLFGGKHSMPSTVQKVSESLPPADYGSIGCVLHQRQH